MKQNNPDEYTERKTMDKPFDPIEPDGAEDILKPPETPLWLFISEFMENRLAVLGFFIFLGIFLIALSAPWISPQNPFDLAQLDIMNSELKPGAKIGDMTFWLGTDGQGRDMLSAIFYGLRVSLTVSVVSTIIAVIIGSVMGLISAYFGGRTDMLVMRIVDIQLSFPPMLVALILIAVLGQGADKIIISLVAVQWAYYARTIRGSALVERSKEYIEAASCLSLSHRRIMFVHLLPNCLPPVIIVLTIQVARAIIIESSLSFLGIGLPITEPSLGLLVANGFEFMLSGMYWISFFPGIALVFTILSINLVGDHLRDILNPRLKK